MSAQTASADAMVEELERDPRPAPREGAGAIHKLRYTHEALIDLIVANPWISQNELCARFGYTPGWMSRIIASDAFQEQLAKRRNEIVDPAIKATLEERFRALVVLSLEKLHEKLAQPVSMVSDNVALRAAELGAKALGLGGHATPPPVAPAADRLASLAERLLVLQSNVRQQGASYAQEGRLLESAAVRAHPGEVIDVTAESAHSGAGDQVTIQHGATAGEVK